MSQDEPTTAQPRAGRAPLPADVVLSATFEVEPSPAGLREARTFVRETLRGWAVDIAVANAALDVAHELVTNAVQHGSAPIVLDIRHATTGIDVTVRDASPEAVRRLPYRPGVSERGLGLRLVAQLAREWGQRSEPTGKSVWAVVDTRPGPSSR